MDDALKAMLGERAINRLVLDYAEAVDRLDEGNGSKVVARLRPTGDGYVELPERNGEPWWDRTTDPLIKSQVLCQLS